MSDYEGWTTKPSGVFRGNLSVVRMGFYDEVLGLDKEFMSRLNLEQAWLIREQHARNAGLLRSEFRRERVKLESEVEDENSKVRRSTTKSRKT